MSFTNNVQSFEMSKKQSTSKRGQWQVILHNDDHNTFDHVVDCLMQICGHSYIQSVQCAHIVHANLHCSVFVDCYDECESVRADLHECGLTVTVLKVKKI
jgi:ATP-dependent Clp protease adaptor protein ClpS